MSSFYAGVLQLTFSLHLFMNHGPYLSLNNLTEVFNNAAKRSV